MSLSTKKVLKQALSLPNLPMAIQFVRRRLRQGHVACTILTLLAVLICNAHLAVATDYVFAYDATTKVHTGSGTFFRISVIKTAGLKNGGATNTAEWVFQSRPDFEGVFYSDCAVNGNGVAIHNQFKAIGSQLRVVMRASTTADCANSYETPSWIDETRSLEVGDRVHFPLTGGQGDFSAVDIERLS
jgi:hypothetical protein